MRVDRLIWTLLSVGCAGSPAPLEPAEALACSVEAAGDGTPAFEVDRLVCVQLTLPATDFTSLADQSRYPGDDVERLEGVVGHLLRSCTEPFPDPYTWFEADVVVDGHAVNQVAVRKKGFIGSAQVASGVRPSLKIQTNRVRDDQRLGEAQRLTLNNNLSDATRMRTCLTYSVFHDADHPAPLCGFANVMVNGRSLGVYTHVESPKRAFLRRAFGNDDGSLYESTVADFTAGHLADTPVSLGRWEAKTSDSDGSGAPLWRVVDALDATDDQLADALDAVLDLDAFLTFWALETVVGHQDGFTGNTNNTYVYFDPADHDRATFIPWGPDDALSGDEPYFVQPQLAARLSHHPVLYDRYLQRVQDVLDTTWDEERLQQRITDWRAVVDAVEPASPEAVDELRSWIDDRRAVVQRFIDDGGVQGDPTADSCWAATDPGGMLELVEVVTLGANACNSAPSGALWWGALLWGGSRRRSESTS